MLSLRLCVPSLLALVACASAQEAALLGRVVPHLGVTHDAPYRASSRIEGEVHGIRASLSALRAELAVGRAGPGARSTVEALILRIQAAAATPGLTAYERQQVHLLDQDLAAVQDGLALVGLGQPVAASRPASSSAPAAAPGALPQEPVPVVVPDLPVPEVPAVEVPAVEVPAVDVAAPALPEPEIPVADAPAALTMPEEPVAPPLPAPEAPTDMPAPELPAVDAPIPEVPTVEVPAMEAPAVEVSETAVIPAPAVESIPSDVPAIDTPSEVPALEVPASDASTTP